MNPLFLRQNEAVFEAQRRKHRHGRGRRRPPGWPRRLHSQNGPRGHRTLPNHQGQGEVSAGRTRENHPGGSGPDPAPMRPLERLWGVRPATHRGSGPDRGEETNFSRHPRPHRENRTGRSRANRRSLPENANRYRMRARFQIRGSEIGFFAPGARRLVAIENCLLVEPPIVNALRQIRHLAPGGAANEESRSRGNDFLGISGRGVRGPVSSSFGTSGSQKPENQSPDVRRMGKIRRGKPFPPGRRRWTKTRGAPRMVCRVPTRYGASGFMPKRIARVLHSAQPGAQPDSREEVSSKNPV